MYKGKGQFLQQVRQELRLWPWVYAQRMATLQLSQFYGYKEIRFGPMWQCYASDLCREHLLASPPSTAYLDETTGLVLSFWYSSQGTDCRQGVTVR